MPREPLTTAAAHGLAAGAIGAVVAALLCVSGGLEVLERAALDWRLRTFPQVRSGAPGVEIVAIDQGSLDAMAARTGYAWPWPRELYGHVVDVLGRAGARAVVFDLLFLEPDGDRPESLGADSDRAFAEAIARSGRVFLAAALGSDSGDAYVPMVAEAESGRFATLGPAACTGRQGRPPPLAYLPVPVLARAAAGIGAVNLPPDDDGLLRRLPPTFAFGRGCAPSLAVAVARAVLGGDAPVAVAVEGLALRLGPRRVPTDGDGRMLLSWYGPGGSAEGAAFGYSPIFDLLLAATRLEAGEEPGIDLSRFSDRVVVLGSTAPGLFDLKPTPMSAEGAYPGVEILATAIDNLLQGTAVRRPGRPVTVLLALALAVLVGLLGALRPAFSWQATVAVAVSALYLAVCAVLFARSRLAPDLAAPLAAALVTAVSALGWRYLYEGRQRRRVRTMFQHYVAEPVVRELLANPDALRLGGERRELTVFFSDIEGFTDLSERLADEPEKLVLVLNEYLTAMGRPILERRGYIDKYIGDAVMAIFGAPIAYDGQAADAVAAALGAHRATDVLNREWRARELPSIATRIGLSTGHAVLGNIGSASRINYTAIGDSVNLASRLEGANKLFGTRTLMCGRTRDLAGEAIRARSLGRLGVKGKENAVAVHEPLCLAGEDGPFSEEFLGTFSYVVTSYASGVFGETAAAARKALKLVEDDGPTKLYLAMAQRRLDQPVGDGWDGTIRLNTKALQVDARYKGDELE